ncbi:MAG: flippase [Nitrospinota bacterium]
MNFISRPVVSKVKLLASNTLFNLINTLFAGVFGIATSIIVARSLGAVQLGEYSYILWLIGILTLFVNAGLPMVVAKYVAEYIGRNDIATAKNIFTVILKLELAVSCIISSLVAYLSLFLTKDVARKELLILSSINIIPIVLARIYSAAATGLQKYQTLIIASLISSPIQFLLIVFTLLAHHNVAGLIVANIIGSVLNLAILWYFIKNEFNRFDSLAMQGIPVQVTRLDTFLKKRIAKYSLSVSGIIIIDAIVWQKSEIFFLERFSPPEEIAFYSLAFTIGYMAMQIPGIFSSLLIPYFSGIYGQGYKPGLKKGYIHSTRYLALIAFPIGIGGAILSAPLIELVYGSEYRNAAIPAQIILVFNSFGAVSRASSAILYGTEEQGFILKWGSIIAIFNIFLNLILIPKYGATGAAIANSSAQMAGVVGGAAYVNNEFGIDYPSKSVLKIFISSIVMGIGMYSVTSLFNGYRSLLLSISLSPFIYLVSLWFIGAIDAEDRRLIYTLLGKNE